MIYCILYIIYLLNMFYVIKYVTYKHLILFYNIRIYFKLNPQPSFFFFITTITTNINI